MIDTYNTIHTTNNKRNTKIIYTGNQHISKVYVVLLTVQLCNHKFWSVNLLSGDGALSGSKDDTNFIRKQHQEFSASLTRYKLCPFMPMPEGK